MAQAVSLAMDNVRAGAGGPFGAIVVYDDVVIGTGVNTVTATNDPTAHAEVNAIRAACQKVGRFHLSGGILFASCEPCPMCLAAIYWARIPVLFYAATMDDARLAGFDDRAIWREMVTTPEARLVRTRRIEIAGATEPFEAWEGAAFKTTY